MKLSNCRRYDSTDNNVCLNCSRTGTISGLTFKFDKLSEIYNCLIFLLSIAWIAMSGWTITRLYNQPLHEGIV